LRVLLSGREVGREKDGRKRKGDEGRDNYLCHKHLSNRRLDLPYRLRANVVNTGWAKKVSLIIFAITLSTASHFS